ncbi:MAG TPA: DUF3536 domain-containing protein [Longimicrobiales bacterium]|nr:DUF3536 domain-containing protein [Longimicrobiales bacterium]
MDRFICVHGHFYQPPRENPWLEAIEQQDEAYPYHDWNARIAAECYAPNAASRILNDRDEIVRIVNNYAQISFNFGPTLLAWLEDHSADIYQAVLRADAESRERFSGHGNAIAQAYNHIILPLANARDQRTQVVWGIRDFRSRFGREPEGLWLPETAVDLASLELLAEHGIKFTILAQHQAGRVRPLAGGDWADVNGSRIDPTRPYLQRLPSGRSIALFFYDGPASRAVAFEGLLRNGATFANRLLGLFDDSRNAPQLVNIATDGETYGHHHRHGDMALAYALRRIELSGQARLTNYGEFLERHPPEMEVEILEYTSWSCSHGIERWRSDCGCHTGGDPGWTQAWRGPLREALDWLRDTVAPLYERAAAELVDDPWAARDDYIDVVLDRDPAVVDRFFARHAHWPLDRAHAMRLLKLLELQRHALLMYTSCGWFFNEVSGIETVQVIMYAGRVVQLANELFRVDLEPEFLSRLANARSNRPEEGDARRIYEKNVQPAMVDLLDVGAHFAASSLFEPYEPRQRIYCYVVTQRAAEFREAGDARLFLGRARIVSEITWESDDVTFAVLHMGNHNLNGGIRRYQGDETFETVLRDFREAFSRADLATVIRLLDRHFGSSTFSLKSLFRDEQRRVLDRILDDTVREAGAVYREVFEHHAPLMRFLLDLALPLPPPFRMAADFTLNRELRRVLEGAEIDLAEARTLLSEAKAFEVALDQRGLAFALSETLVRLAERLRRDPSSYAALEQLVDASELATSFPFEVDLWKTRNIFYGLRENVYPGVRARAQAGDAEARRWVDAFRRLGQHLAVAVESDA